MNVQHLPPELVKTLDSIPVYAITEYIAGRSRSEFIELRRLRLRQRTPLPELQPSRPRFTLNADDVEESYNIDDDALTDYLAKLKRNHCNFDEDDS